MTEDVPFTKRWLHSTSIDLDHDVLDRVADVVLDGMTAAGGGVKNIPPRILVLIKVMAMMIAAMTRTGDPEAEDVAQGFYRTIGGTLEHEVHRFRRAVTRDERAAAKAARNVS